MNPSRRQFPQAPKPSAQVLVTPRRFEALLLAASLIEIVHLVGLFPRRLQVDGWALALIFTFIVPWIAPGLGLAITRKGSAVAKWLLVGLVAITVISATSIGVARWDEPAILAGAIAGLLQVLAISMLFTKVGRSWIRRGSR